MNHEYVVLQRRAMAACAKAPKETREFSVDFSRSKKETTSHQIPALHDLTKGILLSMYYSFIC